MTAKKSPPTVRKADVAKAIEREGAGLLRTVEELGEERASRPLEGPWSARDVLAHCVYWQGMLARMMGASLPPPGWIPRWQSEVDLGTDELNRLTVEHYRAVALPTVIADFRFTADLVKGIVTGMKEENLLLDAGEPWGQGTKVHEAIAGESHGHWKEHADLLAAALKARGA